MTAVLIVIGDTILITLVSVLSVHEPALTVKQEHYHKFNIESNEIYHMYQPLMDGRIFHGYDSYIYVHGMPKLMWAELDLSNESFQVLPKDRRQYSDSQFKFSKL